MNEHLVEHLEELGLSQKEARVYMACLTLGPSTVQKIADFSGIKRVTTYVILESLQSLGLASQSSHGRKTYFSAEDPSNLRRLLDKRDQELSEQKRRLEDILPGLKSLETKPSDSPEVHFYNTKEGINSIFNSYMGEGNIAQGAEMMYGISNIDQVYAYFPEFKAALANPERTKKHIRSRFIYTSQDGPILRESDKKSFRDSRYLPADKFPLNADFNIIGDNIVMLSLVGDSPLGITIHSRELAAGMRAIFEAVWAASEPYNQE